MNTPELDKVISALNGTISMIVLNNQQYAMVDVNLLIDAIKLLQQFKTASGEVVNEHGCNN